MSPVGDVIVRAMMLMVPLIAGYAILVYMLRITPGDWLIALIWMATHLWLDYRLHHR